MYLSKYYYFIDYVLVNEIFKKLNKILYNFC